MKTTDDPYVAADPVLLSWADKNGLSVDFVYRDDTCRSIWVRSVTNREPRGQNAQLWLTPPNTRGDLEVHVAIGTWHHFTSTSLQLLHSTLAAEYDRLLVQSMRANLESS